MQASIGRAISLLLRFRCSSRAVPNAGFSVHESTRKTEIPLFKKMFTSSINWKHHTLKIKDVNYRRSIHLWFIKTNYCKHYILLSSPLQAVFFHLTVSEKGRWSRWVRSEKYYSWPTCWDTKSVCLTCARRKTSQQQFIALEWQISRHKREWKQLRVSKDCAKNHWNTPSG